MSLFNDIDLFSSGRSHVERFDLPDAALTLYEGFFNKHEADQLYASLLAATKWQQDDITVYGKTHLTPRLTAWYGDTDKPYLVSGTKMHPHPWTPDLLLIKKRIEKEAGVHFTSVLLNLYRDGKDGVGWHRDDEVEFGENPVIASVSFGETRPFQLRHKFRKEVGKVEILLKHGSFLLMAGATQHFWEHQVPKTAKSISPRINLTFRVVKFIANGPGE